MDINWQPNSWQLATAGNPSDLKKGGICTYFRETLPIKMLNITDLQECFICETSLNGPSSYIVSLYRSLSQSSEVYDHFVKTYEQLIVHLNSFKSQLLSIMRDLPVSDLMMLTILKVHNLNQLPPLTDCIK